MDLHLSPSVKKAFSDSVKLESSLHSGTCKGISKTAFGFVILATGCIPVDMQMLRIINEPTAAALACYLQKRPKQHFLAYDLGGGSFDTSLLTIGISPAIGVHDVLIFAGDGKNPGQQGFEEDIQKHISWAYRDAPDRFSVYAKTVYMGLVFQYIQKLYMYVPTALLHYSSNGFLVFSAYAVALTQDLVA